MKTKLILIGFFFLLASCAKKGLLPATYVEKPVKNVAKFVTEEYQFKKANKFAYTFSSDDLGSSKYGIGNFKIKKNRLLLDFTDEPWTRPTSTLESQEIAPPDSSRNLYQVQVKTLSGIMLPGVTVLVTNVNNDIIAGAATNINGRAELNVSKESNPARLQISYVEFEDIKYELAAYKSLSVEVTLAETYGARIINKQVEKRIKIKHNGVVINGKEFVKAAQASYK